MTRDYGARYSGRVPSDDIGAVGNGSPCLIQNPQGGTDSAIKIKAHRTASWIVVVVAAMCALLMALGTSTLAQLPPRPTPQPTIMPQPHDSPTNARIELHAQFSADWPGEEKPWQALWTVLQWQDPGLETWSDVMSWQGGLDSVVNDGAAGVVGYKTWWVGGSDQGTGLFRWLVYEAPSGTLLATSESFSLPDGSGGATVVGVTLSPQGRGVPDNCFLPMQAPSGVPLPH